MPFHLLLTKVIQQALSLLILVFSSKGLSQKKYPPSAISFKSPSAFLSGGGV